MWFCLVCCSQLSSLIFSILFSLILWKIHCKKLFKKSSEHHITSSSLSLFVPFLSGIIHQSLVLLCSIRLGILFPSVWSTCLANFSLCCWLFSIFWGNYYNNLAPWWFYDTKNSFHFVLCYKIARFISNLSCSFVWYICHLSSSYIEWIYSSYWLCSSITFRLFTGEITLNFQKMQGCHLRQKISFVGYFVMLIIGWVLEGHTKLK